MFFKWQPTYFKWVDAKIIKKRIGPTTPIHFSIIFKKRLKFKVVFMIDTVHFINSYQTFNISGRPNITLATYQHTITVALNSEARCFSLSTMHCITSSVPSSTNNVHFKKNTVPFFRWLFFCSLYLCKWTIKVCFFKFLLCILIFACASVYLVVQMQF